MKFVFFGTPTLSVIVLEELKKKGLLPSLVVTAPDKPAGRGLHLTPSPTKQWAHQNGIQTIEPDVFDRSVVERLGAVGAEAFVVVAYGTILPQAVLDIPTQGILNVHPSLLPKLRGPSPVRTAILQDMRTVGVTVMEIDERMDHGPVLTQETYTPTPWPPNAHELETHLFERGGALLAEYLPRYVEGSCTLTPQDDAQATYCHLFKKTDGLLDLTADPSTNLLKIHAYAGWPGTYFFDESDTRIKVLSAHIADNLLVLDEVIPEGKHKMQYADFRTSPHQ